MKALSRGILRLLSYFPKYKNDPADSIYEDYCRTQILLLEGLQRVYPALPITLRNIQDRQYAFDRYSNAYRQCRRNYTYLDICLAPLQKPLRKVQARIDAEDFKERVLEEDENLAYQGKLNNVARQESDPNALGNRQIDINADWSIFVGKYATQFPNLYYYLQRNYQKEEIAVNLAELRIDSQLTGQKDLLNPEQRLLYDVVIRYYKDTLAGKNLGQLLLNVDRRASIGKSYIIKLISAYLQILATRAQYRALVLRLALTSVAAYAINSQTLYKLFKLPARSTFDNLAITTLQAV